MIWLVLKVENDFYGHNKLLATISRFSNVSVIDLCYAINYLISNHTLIAYLFSSSNNNNNNNI